MGITENMIVILAIVLLVIICIWLLFRDTEKEESLAESFSYQSLRNKVKVCMNEYTSISVAGMGLARGEVAVQEEQRSRAANNLRRCSGGDSGAREAVKTLVRMFLTNNCGVTAKNIHYAIPFGNPSRMPNRALLYGLILVKERCVERDTGFGEVYRDWRMLCREREDMSGDDFGEDDLRYMYEDEGIMLTYAEQLEILTQLIYEDEYGNGVVDVLNEQRGTIEEYQLGMSGLPQKVYDYRKELLSDDYKKIKYGYDSIHIMVAGKDVRLSFLSFGSEDEMERVIRNLIKNTSAGELTVKKPIVRTETMDGRRILATRHPATEGWNALVRKHDAIASVDLRSLYFVPGADFVADLLSLLVRGGVSAAVTGEMEIGKTTLLRALVVAAKRKRIRFLENDSFELGLHKYLPEGNIMTMRVADGIDFDEIAAALRKTTGQILGIGELDNPKMENLFLDIAPISEQTFTSTHHTSTEGMVSSLTETRLKTSGHSRTAAEMDVVKALGIDAHVRATEQGERYIAWVNEVVPDKDFAKYEPVPLSDDNISEQGVQALRDIRQQMAQVKTYHVRKILWYDEEKQDYFICNKPSSKIFERARRVMSSTEYKEFVDFFNGPAFKGEEGYLRNKISSSVAREGDVSA